MVFKTIFSLLTIRIYTLPSVTRLTYVCIFRQLLRHLIKHQFLSKIA